MTLSTVDNPSNRQETSLPPLRDDGKRPDGMTAGERARWIWETRLKQLVIAEAKAWRRLAWGPGIYSGLLLLIPLGVLLADSSIGVYGSYAKSTLPEGIRIAGLMLQGFGWTIFYLLGIPVLLCSARWIEAMRQRRRFSSTPGADPGHPPRR